MKKNLSANKGVITFYTVGNVSPYYINERSVNSDDERREHGTVISKYDKERDVCTLNHWGKKFPGIPVEILFNSNANLKSTRSQEFYDMTKKSERHLSQEAELNSLGYRQYKYISIEGVTGDSSKNYEDDRFMRSIIPEPNSGFKGIIMAIEPNQQHTRWSA